MRNRPAVFKRSRGFRLTPPIALAALAAVMALVAGGLYVMDPGSAPPGGGVPRAQAPPGLPYPEVPRVSVGEAKALLDANGAIFLDVRGPAEYGLGHIPGAVLMPLPDVERRAAEVPKASPVIAYCT